MLMLSLF